MDIDAYLKNIEIISDRFCNICDTKVANLDEPYPIDQYLVDTLMSMVEVKKQIIITVSDTKTQQALAKPVK